MDVIRNENIRRTGHVRCFRDNARGVLGLSVALY